MIDKWFVNDIEYIKPEMQVHEIEAQQLLAGSQTVESVSYTHLTLPTKA